MENTTEKPPADNPPVTDQQYQYALAQLLFHQSKVDHYIKITRAYNYQIEKR